MTALANSFEGGTNGTTISSGNSGGTSGNAFDGVAGTALTFDNAHAAHGSLACKVVLGTSGTQTYVLWAASLGAITSASDLFIRYYLFLTANPSANEYICRFSQPGTSGGGHICGFGITSAGLPAIYDTGASTSPKVSGPTALPLNQWIRIEGHCGALSATATSMELKVWLSADSSGTPDYDLTTSTGNTGTSVPTNFGFGLEKSAVSTTVWLDDVGFSTTGFIGPVSGAQNLSPAAIDTTAATNKVTAKTSFSSSAAGVSAMTAILTAGAPHLSLTAGASSRASAIITTPATWRAGVREFPPLRLNVNVETPSGREARWSSVDTNPTNAISGLSFSTTMPGGFEHADMRLTRDPRRSFPDLQELSTLTVRGVGGSVAWQGRLETIPSASGDSISISPGAVGWQSHLDDRSDVRELFVEIGLTNWQAASIQRKINVLLVNLDLDDASARPEPNGTACVDTELQGTWSRGHFAEAWYDAKGVDIGELRYTWEQQHDASGNPMCDPTNTNWEWLCCLSQDDVLGVISNSGNRRAAGPESGSVPGGSGYTYAAVQFGYAAPGVPPAINDGVLYDIYWTALWLYGAHGLSTATTLDNTDGILGSDILAYTIAKYCPKLALTSAGQSTITPSDFVIPQLTYLDPTTTSQVLKDVTQYDLQDWAVWEGPTFWWYPRNTRGRKWRGRIGPSNLQQAGPQIDRLWNGVIVTYTDVLGVSRSVGPPGSSVPLNVPLAQGGTISGQDDSLLDADPLNPINELGINRWAILAMPGVSTASAAIKIGQIFLALQRQVNTSGSAVLNGYVEDDKGVIWPAWMVRAGDQISFVDAANPNYRRIVSTSYNDDSRVNSLTLDTPPDTLQAILARLQVTLAPVTGG